MTTDVKSTVLKVLNQYSEVPFTEATLDPSLTIEQLKLDSLDILELIYELEEEFGIELDASELKQLTTLADLIKVFELHIRRAA